MPNLQYNIITIVCCTLYLNACVECRHHISRAILSPWCIMHGILAHVYSIDTKLEERFDYNSALCTVFQYMCTVLPYLHSDMLTRFAYCPASVPIEVTTACTTRSIHIHCDKCFHYRWPYTPPHRPTFTHVYTEREKERQSHRHIHLCRYTQRHPHSHEFFLFSVTQSHIYTRVYQELHTHRHIRTLSRIHTHTQSPTLMHFVTLAATQRDLRHTINGPNEIPRTWIQTAHTRGYMLQLHWTYVRYIYQGTYLKDTPKPAPSGTAHATSVSHPRSHTVTIATHHCRMR